MVNVSICVGSACHMKGAYATTKIFREELQRAGIADQVHLSASFCMGNCKDGPCVKVNDVLHTHVDAQRVPSLIQEAIVPLIGA